MDILDVPFTHQISENACGAAALEMVYRYFRPSKLSKFSQQKVYQRRREAEPHGSGGYRISTDDMVAIAQQRGFFAAWGRVNPEVDAMTRQIKQFIVTERIPLIACQRYDDQNHLFGHFRVIIGIDDDDGIIFHDPCAKIGGPARSANLASFLHLWRPTGENVTGGVAIWIGKRALAADPLLPLIRLAGTVIFGIPQPNRSGLSLTLERLQCLICLPAYRRNLSFLRARRMGRFKENRCLE
jgi:hypothetical protein